MAGLLFWWAWHPAFSMVKLLVLLVGWKDMDQNFLTKTDPNLTGFSLLFLQELNLKNMITSSPEILVHSHPKLGKPRLNLLVLPVFSLCIWPHWWLGNTAFRKDVFSSGLSKNLRWKRGSWREGKFKVRDIAIVMKIDHTLIISNYCFGNGNLTTISPRTATVGQSFCAYCDQHQLSCFVFQVTNCWLVLYTWLQHTDVDIPHFDKEPFLQMAQWNSGSNNDCLTPLDLRVS